MGCVLHFYVLRPSMDAFIFYLLTQKRRLYTPIVFLRVHLLGAIKSVKII